MRYSRLKISPLRLTRLYLSLERLHSKELMMKMFIAVLCLLFLYLNEVGAEDRSKQTKVEHQSPPSTTGSGEFSLPSRGWSVSGFTGLNQCLPSGSARCDSSYPGLNLGLSTEYKWRYVGITSHLDWGTLTPLGEGSEALSHRLSRLGIGARAYAPRSKVKSYYLGMSIGKGDVVIQDTKSDSSVTWSTLWSSFKIDLGALWLKKENFAIESAISFLMNLGGERCVLFRGAGPCQAVKDLPEIQQSSSRVLMLSLGARWMP